MVYFIFDGVYCSAEEINEQMAEKVHFITKEEYENKIAELEKEDEEENQDE